MKKLLLTLLPIFMIFSSKASSEEEKWTMPEKPIVVIETNQGNIEVELFPKQAPQTCENFIKLAQKGYYNGVSFHRIIPNFMIQGGDPTGTGRGGASIFGKPFKDECCAELTFDKAGLLAMANAGPNTNGSQFFITTTKTPHLNMKHTIFGQVTSGMDVLKKLEASGSGTGAPKSPQTITRMYLKKA